MSVPYAHTPRPDTGMTNARLGMGLFLAADAMFCGALFSSYAFLRTAAGYWPVGREVLPMRLNGLALAATATACAMALYAWTGARGTRLSTRVRAGSSAGWGALSLLLTAGALHQALENAGPPAANTFLAIYYMLSAVVTVHVVTASTLSAVTALKSARLGDNLLLSRLGSVGLLWAFTLFMAATCFISFYLL